MEWGYEVICAEDGEDAIRMAAKFRPALIVLDLGMPRMNGFAFRTWQLAQPRLADIPVIVLTAEGPQAADRLAGVSALYKPLDVGLLQVFLNLHVQPASPRQSIADEQNHRALAAPRTNRQSGRFTVPCYPTLSANIP